LNNEERIRAHFEQCGGTIVDVAIKRYNMETNTGYGFLIFSSFTEAETSAQALNNSCDESFRYFCELSHQSREKKTKMKRGAASTVISSSQNIPAEQATAVPEEERYSVSPGLRLSPPHSSAPRLLPRGGSVSSMGSLGDDENSITKVVASPAGSQRGGRGGRARSRTGSSIPAFSRSHSGTPPDLRSQPKSAAPANQYQPQQQLQMSLAQPGFYSTSSSPSLQGKSIVPTVFTPVSFPLGIVNPSGYATAPNYYYPQQHQQLLPLSAHQISPQHSMTAQNLQSPFGYVPTIQYDPQQQPPPPRLQMQPTMESNSSPQMVYYPYLRPSTSAIGDPSQLSSTHDLLHRRVIPSIDPQTGQIVYSSSNSGNSTGNYNYSQQP
jgi:RNA recognition motif-containing protein